MKKFFFIGFFIFRVVQALPVLNLDVADQNFNSTDKIIIDQDEIQKSRASNLPALLLTKANISISTNNVQPNSIYIRGGDSSHVLILIDGVPAYDASSPQRTVNLFSLNVSKIKRITILKGSQSVLYGGQAMSGVIQIETFSSEAKKATSVTADTAFSRDAGTKQTVSVGTLHAVSDTIFVNSSFYGLTAQNNSPAKDSDKLYPQKSGSADIGVQVRGDFENIFKISYSKDDNAITNSNFANSKAIDTEDFIARTESVGAAWVLKKSESFSLTSSFQKINRAFDQPAAEASTPADVDQKYEGTLSNIRLDGNLFRNEVAQLSGGLQITNEAMIFKNNGVTGLKNDTQYEGIYLKLDYRLPADLFFELGARQESSKFTSLAQSYQAGLTWNKIVKLEYSTGFKTASLFQLYAVGYGNPDLQPEKSKNLSLSVEHQFSNQFFASVTYFDSEFENLIDYSFVLNKYNNLSKTRTVGAEAQASANFLEGQLRFSVSLGYQEPRDLSKNQWLVRRSLHTGGFKISVDLFSQTDAGAEVIYVGEKLDKAGPAYVMVEDYALVNIFGNWNFSAGNTIFARVENIEGKEYQTTYGFYNSAAIYKLGVQINF